MTGIDSPIRFYDGPMSAGLTVKAADGRDLIRIHADGRVEAPDMESASEAGRRFADGIREGLASQGGRS